LKLFSYLKLKDTTFTTHISVASHAIGTQAKESAQLMMMWWCWRTITVSWRNSSAYIRKHRRMRVIYKE